MPVFTGGFLTVSTFLVLPYFISDVTGILRTCGPRRLSLRQGCKNTNWRRLVCEAEDQVDLARKAPPRALGMISDVCIERSIVDVDAGCLSGPQHGPFVHFSEARMFFGQFPGRDILIYAGAVARRTDLVPDPVSWSISWELDSKAARQV